MKKKHIHSNITGEICEKLKNNIFNCNIDESVKTCKVAINASVDPMLLINNGISPGLHLVGEKFEKGEYFLSELILAGEIVKECMNIIEPYLSPQHLKTKNIIILGTVKGDLHDIGKNIFGILMKSIGFNVIDLGVDVSPEQFIKAVKDYSPKILGMSALLSTTLANMKTTIDRLTQENLRKKVKIIIGGAPIDLDYAMKMGADAATNDAFEGLEICKNWV